MRKSFIILLQFLFTIALNAQSVLEKDGIIKVAISEEGVYKIDYQFFTQIGLDPASISPHKIQVFGMVGGMLPQSNSVDYPHTPQAVPILKNSNSNNQLEDGEYILFYASSVDDITYDVEEERYRYNKNVYSDSLYFYIDIQNEHQKLISESTQLVNSANRSINTYDQIIIHEEDLVNILNSGRNWYGESFFSEKQKTFDFNTQNDLAVNANLILETQYLAQTLNQDTLRLSINGFTISQLSLTRINSQAYSDEGKVENSINIINSSLLNNSRSLTVTVNHLASSTINSSGRLDYLFLTVPLKLNFNNQQIIVRNRMFQQESAFQLIINGLQNEQVWEVGNALKPTLISHNAGIFNFLPNSQVESKFVVFSETTAPRPDFVSILKKHNLRNISPDLLIISHELFRSSADKLANHRRSFSGMDVKVANVKDIINEYGAGRADVSAIRNYIKDLYDTTPGKLKYVLIMGAGSYDHKDRLPNNTNYVPIYQSRNSVSPTYTYSSDDYYALMEPHEGEWEETVSENSDLDLGIGRIACRTSEEALHSVNKIIRYDSDKILNRKWRNEVYFVADDEERQSSVNDFYEDTDKLIDSVTTNYGNININKIYLGAYEQEVFASYERSPKVREALNQMMNKGALIVNYMGHGAFNSWADEAILTNEMISAWENSNSFPVFVTATCEFGRHDSPGILSGAQLMLHKENAGAIALLTTSRPVYSTSNFNLNQAFFENVFVRPNSKVPSLGDVIRNTKNFSIEGVNNRNFILLGDPSMQLGIAQHQVLIDSIYTSSGNADSIRAEDKVTISGHIASERSGALFTDFQGVLLAEMYDKPINKSTLTEENPYVFKSFDQVIYRGKSTIKDGFFTFEFYMPKDINYNIEEGKLSLYAYQENSVEDATGFSKPFIGGSADKSVSDNQGPDVEPFLNDISFESGDEVGEKNKLLIHLFDEHGISISESELNEGIFYVLDGTYKEKVNDYFTYDIDSYQSGEILIDLPQVNKGWHEIEVVAKDVMNNTNTASIGFYVVDGESLNILDFVMYPNPAVNQVEMNFHHNRNEEEVMVSFTIFDGSGSIALKDSFTTAQYNNKYLWDLRLGGGQKVKAGMYFIDLSVRSLSDGSKSRRIKKLIIIN